MNCLVPWTLCNGHQVVREQCWLNEVLSGCEWKTEGLHLSQEPDEEQQETEATEEDLHAVLSGIDLSFLLDAD